MAGKMYAWTNFPVEWNEYGQVTKTIKVGEGVTANALGISDEEFDDLVEIGAVSEEEYPDIPDTVSPAEYEQQLANVQTTVASLQEQMPDREVRLGDAPKPTEPAPTQQPAKTPASKE